MTENHLPRFEDWEANKMKDAAFDAAAKELEPGYQVARLRIQRGFTQTQLAEMIGTRQPSIARLENGSSLPSISFLNKIATALDAKIEVRLIAENKTEYHT
ncbi:MAG: helix-turn-helix domain-containing protein [Bellilinea sp.]